MNMFVLPTIEFHRMASLSWTDKNGDLQSVPICTLSSSADEIKFEKEFHKEGILYERILKAVGLNPNSKVRNLHLVFHHIHHFNFREDECNVRNYKN